MTTKRRWTMYDDVGPSDPSSNSDPDIADDDVNYPRKKRMSTDMFRYLCVCRQRQTREHAGDGKCKCATSAAACH